MYRCATVSTDEPEKLIEQRPGGRVVHVGTEIVLVGGSIATDREKSHRVQPRVVARLAPRSNPTGSRCSSPGSANPHRTRRCSDSRKHPDTTTPKDRLCRRTRIQLWDRPSRDRSPDGVSGSRFVVNTTRHRRCLQVPRSGRVGIATTSPPRRRLMSLDSAESEPVTFASGILGGGRERGQRGFLCPAVVRFTRR